MDLPGNVVANAGPDSAPTLKAFPCQHCNRSFTRPENLTRHARIHGLVLPLACQTCGKRFSRSDVLARHESMHQKLCASQRRPYTDTANSGPRKKQNSAQQNMAMGSAASVEFAPGANNDNQPGDAAGAPRVEYNMNKDRNSSQVVLSTMEDAELPAGAQAGYVNSTAICGPLPDCLLDEPVGAAPSNPYFDFSSTWAWHESDSPTGTDWFSHDFYHVLCEMDYAWNPEMPGAVLPFWQGTTASAWQSMTLGRGDEDQLLNQDETLPGQNIPPRESGRSSRLPSPPNEASFEDRLAFAWDPRSRPISNTHAIVPPPDDPMFKNHDTRFDVTEPVWNEVGEFIMSGDPVMGEDPPVLPSLAVVNAFIGLFFKNFSHQVPVLHQPTLQMSSLPRPLLAVLIVIGAKYSRLRHTRRFAIIVMDKVRRNLHHLIERDNSLMREPLIIFAYALICYTGLWCGNKRAFEIAEVVRAAMVTYMRRVTRHDNPNWQSWSNSDLQGQWTHWSAQESRKRLGWVVYTIDSQFPTLLNMPNMLSVAEVAKWECPCAEQFWNAPSARRWKSLLGAAPIPPAPTFAAAISPFKCLTFSSGEEVHAAQPLNLDSWSAFLVMVAIAIDVFEYSTKRTLAAEIMPDLDDGDEHGKFHGASHHAHLAELRRSLSGCLALWEMTYRSAAHGTVPSEPSSSHFHASSQLLLRLSNMFIRISLTDLQEAIGKEGPLNATAALARLARWCSNSSSDPQVDDDAADPARKHFQTSVMPAVSEAWRIIPHIMQAENQKATPYSIIGLFISHIALWAVASVSPQLLKQELSQSMIEGPVGVTTAAELPSERGLVTKALEMGINQEQPWLILRHGSKSLTRLADWGGSLNLALLLRWLYKLS